MNAPMSPEAQQLIEQLNGVIAPQATFELAVGWWVVIGWSIALLTALCIWLIHTYQKNRYRRRALARLKARHAEASLDYAEWTNGLLKQVAIGVYGRNRVAPLSGDQWVQFLDQSKGSTSFPNPVQETLAEGIYRGELQATGDQIRRFAENWIKYHQSTPNRSRRQHV